MIAKWFDKNGTLVLWASALVALVTYALLSIGNHEAFHTYCLDLGVYSNAIYSYGHLQWADTSTYLWEVKNLLSDHFDLYLILLSPLGYIFGAYTLLIVQLLAAIAGGVGVYRLLSLYSEDKLLPWLAACSFWAFYGLWHAMAFDYHSSVVATCLVPWLLLLLKQRRFVCAAVLLLLICLAKETMPLWMFFVLLALLWDYRKDRASLCFLGAGMAFTALYFVLVFAVVMPRLGDNSQVMWRYDYMGGTIGEKLSSVLHHPGKIAQLLLLRPEGDFATDAWGSYVLSKTKLETYLCLLLSGVMLLLKPNYWVMLIPIFGQRMLTSDVAFWGITNHYNVELAPVSVIGGFIAISQRKSRPLRQGVAVLSLLMTLGVTYYTIDHPQTQIRTEKVRVLSRDHYRQQAFDAEAARRMLKAIPDDASVCATTMFVPHLAMRDSIYKFPVGFQYNPEYYMLLREHWCYYKGEQAAALRLIDDTIHYQVVDESRNLVLIKRKN